MSSTVRTTKYTYRSGGGGGANVEMEYGTDLGALTRLEDKIRLLHEDLESERELRQRVERERSDLTVQLMSLSERLDESEGNSSHVLDAHKKRDAEVGKLRKLLEDMHAESEENAHHLRTKHAAAVSELQEQMEALAKAKSKAEKEKAKFQAEVFELLSQVESVNKEKHVFVKTVEKLEHSVHESHVRIEELVRSVTEVTATRTRLATENTELAKEVHETKVALDTSLHVKGQLATQLEEARRRLEDEERRRSSLEQHSHTLELDLESHKVQLEEESEARLELERQLAKAHGEAAAWHSKYDLELVAHVEAVEELRKRLHLKISEYEEQLEALGQRCSALDKHKSRLTQEVEVLIMDLDKATQAAQGLEKRCQGLEKDNSSLRSRVEELTTLLEVSVRDLRLRTQELAKASHEADKLRDLKEQLLREVKKLTDDLTETKAVLGDSQRRLHETETELRRLENEHSELGAAYKEAEQLRRQEEQRAQRLGAELAQVRHEAEKRLLQKQDELDQVRKSLTLELDALNLKLVEAETRLKTEVTRIKKKLQVTITELEMSLDVSQRSQLELQKTVKRQSVQISELQTHYEEVHRQLQQAVDQLSGAQRRNQGLLAELEELRVALDTSLRAKRLVETSLEEIQVRVNELTQVNVNLASAKGKLESEYGALQADYDSVHKELRVADERVQRTLVDLKVTKDALVEETERYTRVETIRRTLETEVKSLTVRLTEVEASALAGGKRVISKLETRIRDAELELEDERRKHAESQKQLRKKEHRVKELLVASEEDHKAVALLQDTCDKLSDRLKAYKRQLSDQEGSTQQNLTRVRRFQRELEAAEDRAEAAESNLSMIRAKHRSWVTTTQLPGGGSRQVLVTQTEEHSSSNQASSF